MGKHDTSNISKTVIDVSEINQKCRLRQRKEFFVKRKYIADAMLFFGLIGIILMILLVEFNLISIETYRMNNLNSFLSQIRLNLIIKYIVSMTTLILLALVFAYHWMDLNIFCINNSILDWRISITFKRLFFIFAECIVVLIHPVPFNYNIDTTASDFAEQIQYDVILSLPMFARTYLLFRVMLLNSKVVNDACSQSIGFLNKVKINFKFYFKYVMNQHPDSVLAIATLYVFILAAWSIRACECSVVNHNAKFNFVNSFWLIAITFLTIG
jgi:hypothetical protein